MNELEKLDVLKSRLGIGYAQAKEVLDAAEGDVIKALVDWEIKGMSGQESGEAGAQDKKITDYVQERSQELVGQLKGALQKTQGSRIKIKHGEKTVLEMPTPVGALGVLGVLASSQLAVLGALGSLVAMAHNYTLEFEPGKNKTDSEANQDQESTAKEAAEGISSQENANEQ